MTDRERYQRAFDTLHASREITLEVTMKTWNGKKTAILWACVLVLLGMGVTAYALGGTYFGWKNNLAVHVGEDGDGTIGSATLNTDKLTEPVILENGRMMFVVNNEHIDITDRISLEKAFEYRYTDEEGVEHLWLVGSSGDPHSDYGYAEFLLLDGEMLGGFSIGAEYSEDGSSVPWLDRGRPY